MLLFSPRNLLFTLAALLLLPVSNAFAQKPTGRFEELSSSIKPGDRVTIVTIDGTRINAEVVELTAASIVITPDSSQQTKTLPATDVGRILLKDPKGNGVKLGAGIGAAAGLVAGLLFNTYCENETGACPGAIVAFTALGAGGGAATGWGLNKSRRQRIVFERTNVKIESEHFLEFFGSVVLHQASNTYNGLSSVNLPKLRIAGGIGRQAVTGLGFEAEIQRSVQSAVKKDPCLTTAFGPQPGACVGSGLQGIESQWVSTGRVVYSFHIPRMQPFVSGGFSVLSSFTQFAYVGSVNGIPKVTQEHWHFTDYAMPVGGGVQMPITRSIALRPAVVYYFGVKHYEASVGIVYRLK